MDIVVTHYAVEMLTSVMRKSNKHLPLCTVRSCAFSDLSVLKENEGPYCIMFSGRCRRRWIFCLSISLESYAFAFSTNCLQISSAYSAVLRVNHSQYASLNTCMDRVKIGLARSNEIG